MNKTATRRTILAGLDAAPVADPVLAALAEHRNAREAMDAAFARSASVLAAAERNGIGAAMKATEADEEAPFRSLLAAENAALEARPTTRQGAIRLLAHVADRLGSDNATDRETELAPDAIRAALAVLEREGRDVADEPASVVEKYEDLESDICDLRNMSDLSNSYIEHSLSGFGARVQIGDEMMIAITEREADIILFSVYQIEGMTKELKAKFYAIGEGKKS